MILLRSDEYQVDPLYLTNHEGELSTSNQLAASYSILMLRLASQ